MTTPDLEIDQIAGALTPAQKAMFYAQFNAAKKNRSTAIALSVIPVIGHVGAGRFYLGQTGLGVLHIALMVLFVVPGIVYWVVDWFIIGKACDIWNQEKAREIAAQVRTVEI